ncbi:hypothetical protein T8T21_18750 (plasmid) [Limimaricola variabilis]|uniref:hypothetical protein n=1 Tax=Limimaricola variabilis TaxID=1492771 RepID=UPI002AC98767|nr:hypothetical protein [Limimaricola variabilis]WPY96761.1 hypothetical protein T8T21_18750 [Limimaricola variabilis]
MILHLGSLHGDEIPEGRRSFDCRGSGIEPATGGQGGPTLLPAENAEDRDGGSLLSDLSNACICLHFCFEWRQTGRRNQVLT